LPAQNIPKEDSATIYEGFCRDQSKPTLYHRQTSQ